MIKKEFTRKDGSKGFSYFPEHDDLFIVSEEKVRQFENLVIVDGEPKKIYNRVLRVTSPNVDNDEIFDLRITEGHKKVLDKTSNLLMKTIKFKNYTHKDFGVLLGVMVL